MKINAWIFNQKTFIEFIPVQSYKYARKIELFTWKKKYFTATGENLLANLRNWNFVIIFHWLSSIESLQFFCFCCYISVSVSYLFRFAVYYSMIYYKIHLFFTAEKGEVFCSRSKKAFSDRKKDIFIHSLKVFFSFLLLWFQTISVVRRRERDSIEWKYSMI